MAMAKMFNFGRKGVSISASGTDIAVYLLDFTCMCVRVSTATTAAAVCIAVRGALQLRYDAHYSLYEYADGVYRIIDDATVLSKLLAKWPQESAQVHAHTHAHAVAAAGTQPSPTAAASGAPSSSLRYLVFKRSVHLSGSPTESDELASTSSSAGAHRTCVADAVHAFTHGYLRAEMNWVITTTAWLLQAARGDAQPDRDSVANLRNFIVSAVPLYAVKGAGVPREDPRSHGVLPSAGSMHVEDIATRVAHAWAALSGRSPLQAQKMFIKLCKETPMYGCEFYAAKRTWKETEPTAPGKTGKTEIARTEDVIAAVGADGLILMSCNDPHAVTTYDMQEVTKWTVSRDGKIFAFSMEDERIIYLVTEAAGQIERTVERCVNERVRTLAAVDSEKFLPPRSEASAGSPIPAVVSVTPAPLPPYAVLPMADAAPSSTAIAGAAPSLQNDVHPSIETPAAASSSSSALPPGWKALTDADGDVYYWNENTDETTWEMPRASAPAPAAAAPSSPVRSSSAGGLPPGWEAVQDEDGDTYYFNSTTGETTWERPAEASSSPSKSHAAPAAASSASSGGLPAGWEAVQDADGDTYYYNSTSGETTWERPT